MKAQSGVLNLVEDLDESVLDLEGAVVSLNPDVSWALTQKGIAYSIPEDFYPMAKLHAREREYSRLFARWVDAFDDRLKPEFPALAAAGMGPARLYGYYLRFVTDGPVITALRVQAILDALKPETVVFHTRRVDEPAIDFQLAFNGPSLFARVLPAVCAKRGIAFRENALAGKGGASAARRWAGPVIGGLKAAARRLRDTARGLRSSGAADAPVALIIHGASGGLAGVEASAAGRGYRILRSLGAPVLSVKRPGLSAKISGGTEVFSEFAGFDLSEFIAARIRYFVEEVCPRLEAGFQGSLELLKKRKIRFVAAPYKWELEDFTLMAAAAASDTTLAVQVLHGWSILEDATWEMSERPCNLYVATDEEFGAYFSDKVFKGTATVVKTAALWTKNYEGVSIRPVDGRPVVIYLPTLCSGRWLRLQAANYSEDWYFRHQLALLDYFLKEKDFHFIWKGDKGPEKIADPIGRAIAAAKGANIEFAGGKMRDHIVRSSLALHDYPSTPLFETLLAGLPSFCVYHESMIARPSAADLLGPVLKTFSTTEQATRQIGEFLRGDHSRYRKTVPAARADAFEVIESALQETCR